jgi:hypothetical protein
MAHLPIQCQNCGAKYKIPETFPGDFAKCKACGTKIDVKAARGGPSTEADASSRTSTKRSTGGSRKPRPAAETRSGSEPKRGEDKATGRTSRRGATAGKRNNDSGEEGGRRGYEKKKDNSKVLLLGSLGVLAILAIILFMVWGGGEEPTNTGGKTANKNAPNKVVETPKDAGGDAKIIDPDAVAKKAAADKAAADKAAADKAAAEKKKAAAKPKKSSEIKAAADVFKPSALEKLPNTEGTSEEDVIIINEQLDYLKEGGGLPFIRAPKKLQGIGAKMIPLAVNRMMTLDYSKAEDNQYAFAISQAIMLLTEFELAFDPARIVDEFKLTQGHDNAKKVKDLHLLTRKYWGTDKAIKAHIAKRNK